MAQAVKQAMIDTKYTDEVVSFGQAVVTHHFMDNSLQGAAAAQGQGPKWQTAQEAPRPSHQRSRSPQKEVVSQMSINN